MTSPTGKSVAFFAPDFTEVSTITRARTFCDQGYDVTVFAFRRARYNQSFHAPWREVDLGRTRDGRYLDRGFKLLKATLVIWKRRKTLKGATLLYASNIDQLILAFIVKNCFVRECPVVYEVLDISNVFTRRGLVSSVMRRVERGLLRRIDKLVVSSPAFSTEYFQKIQHYDGPVSLIENRLHGDDAARFGKPVKRRHGTTLYGRDYKWVVGYFGLIRGRPTFDLMMCMAQKCPEVVFYIRGVPTTVDADYFVAMLANNTNITYDGAYRNPDDLDSLYGAVDFSWAIDLEHPDANSQWLMPCRFYEASLLGVPTLATANSELGRQVIRDGTGWTFEQPWEESLVRFFNTLSQEDYDEKAGRLAAMPPSRFIIENMDAAAAEPLSPDCN